LYFSLFVSLNLFSQQITVDNTSNSQEQLVNLLLGNSCVGVSNISISSPQSVAHFNKNNSTFPINEGVIIRNGIATNTQGPFTNTNLSSQINTNSDAFLQNLSISSGQPSTVTDVAFLEFDFVPISNSFSFNFLFASNEYGEYQCEFSDVFAFVLTNLNTNSSSNLAVVPGTNIPVTVKDIRDAQYNFPGDECVSANQDFFAVYNPANPSAATLNMRGHTVVMSAASTVIPNTPYKIRLVIGDYNDSNYDSAVFLAAGSFVTNLDLGPNQTICTGDEIQLNTNLDTNFTFKWFENGVEIPGETNPTYTVNHPGTYTVEAIKNTCVITDTIVFNDLVVETPKDLFVCRTTAPSYSFNLLENDAAFLGINTSNYEILYYASLNAIANNNPISTANLTNYQVSNTQTIYIKLKNSNTGIFCDAVYTFQLVVTPIITATQPNDIPVCDTPGGFQYSFDTDLGIYAEVLNGLPASEYDVFFYNTLAEAISNSNPILSTIIPFGATTHLVYIRLENKLNRSCFGTTIVTFIVNPRPLVDELEDPIECHEYILPPLENGNYFTDTNGGGTPLFAGDSIDTGGTYYIFNGPDANGCTNQSSFEVTLIDEFDPSLDHCGSFNVPYPPKFVGNFYTEIGGPNGSGVLVTSGTVYTNTTNETISVTLYYYAEIEGSLCRDDAFTFLIHPSPIVSTLGSYIGCNSYVLPPVANGNYFSQPGGTGTALFAGDVISVSGPNYPGTYYIHDKIEHLTSTNEVGFCGIDNAFEVKLVDTTIFQPLTDCTIQLPFITFGGYFTEPNGGGTPITNYTITTSQVVYYFVPTTTLPNCTANLNYDITIKPGPPIDNVPSGNFCGKFVLPVLQNGTYYKLPGGPTTVGQQQLNAGQVIDLSGLNLAPGTFYIFDGPNENGCISENSFTISVSPFPPADGVLSETKCSPYTIPTPVNGTIYTQSGGPSGGGSVVSSSTVFNSTQTFYLYNMDATTGCKVDKPFTITYHGINLPVYQDVRKCDQDNFQLPALTHTVTSPFNYSIGYFYSPNGENPVLPNTVFNTPGSTTIYVFAKNGDRIVCTQEASFQIIISETPNLAALNLVFNAEACDTYVLPTLPTTNYNIHYYSQSGGNPAHLITNLTIGTPGNFTYYVYASATNNLNCNDEIAFNFTIHPLREITLKDGIICVDAITDTVYRPYTLNTGLSPNEYTVNWYLNGVLMGTGTSYIVTKAGTYDVEFIKLTPDIGALCSYENTSVTISQSSPAVANFEVSSPFENNTFITVNITNGYGEYEYQLEGANGFVSEIQSNNVFINLATGEYFINIYDLYGDCSPTRLGPIYIVNYPNFFTPNGDGIHDTWNIWDLSYQADALISIFDRQGKLLKQIAPNGIGWDGTYNGANLPSTDYWFSVDYALQNSGIRKIFKAHFTLKR